MCFEFKLCATLCGMPLRHSSVEIVRFCELGPARSRYCLSSLERQHKCQRAAAAAVALGKVAASCWQLNLIRTVSNMSKPMTGRDACFLAKDLDAELTAMHVLKHLQEAAAIVTQMNVQEMSNPTAYRST